MRIWLSVIAFVCFSVLQSRAQAALDSLESDLPSSQRMDSLMHFAERFIGKPYGFGSTGPNTFDCSGFVQFVYGHFGVKLPHGSGTQAAACHDVEWKDIQAGDLLFFNGRKRNGQIGHVAIVHHINGSEVFMIHATVQAGVLLESMPASAYFKPRFIRAGRLKNGFNLSAE